jgi:hypothetical protein
LPVAEVRIDVSQKKQGYPEVAQEAKAGLCGRTACGQGDRRNEKVGQVQWVTTGKQKAVRARW